MGFQLNLANFFNQDESTKGRPFEAIRAPYGGTKLGLTRFFGDLSLSELKVRCDIRLLLEGKK